MRVLFKSNRDHLTRDDVEKSIKIMWKKFKNHFCQTFNRNVRALNYLKKEIKPDNQFALRHEHILT